MRLGLLTDIHEGVHNLRLALAQFAADRVDQVVILGDAFRVGEQIEETCRLLAEARAVGVWGNHDFGLSFEPVDEVRQRFSPAVLDFMATLQPRLEIEGCHCSHVEPWLNPHDPADLWFYEGPPRKPARLERIFGANASRVMFAGHYHHWLAYTPEGPLVWDGATPLRLAPPQRFFVVIDALVEGGFAIYDTQTAELVPFQLPVFLEETHCDP